MKAEIAKRGCNGCGLCTDICPAVFRMTANTYAEVYADEVSKKDTKNAREAMENCPVSVISIKE